VRHECPHSPEVAGIPLGHQAQLDSKPALPADLGRLLHDQGVRLCAMSARTAQKLQAYLRNTSHSLMTNPHCRQTWATSCMTREDS
jgi:hypothetical protein